MLLLDSPLRLSLKRFCALYGSRYSNGIRVCLSSAVTGTKASVTETLPVKTETGAETGTETQAPITGTPPIHQQLACHQRKRIKTTSKQVRPSRHVARSPAPRSHVQQTPATPLSAFCFCAVNEVQQAANQSKCTSCIQHAPY